MKALITARGPIIIGSTREHGIDPDRVEATAFAWLARQNLAEKTGKHSGGDRRTSPGRAGKTVLTLARE
jgi:1,6-anhydro-N-acetylmuramate kinase